MFKRDIKEVLDDIRYSEELLSMEELSDAMKDYMKYTDELIVSMQAYIDYLLIDEDSIDGDDIKPWSSIVQLAERPTVNRQVPGSSPGGRAKGV